QQNHRVRQVSTAGIINTIAGTGAYGYNGDGIIATSAQLYTPFDVAVDAAGYVYIADAGNNRIRKIVSGPTTDVNLKSNEFSVQELYPNPTKVDINVHSTDKITHLTITNLLGQTLYT